MNIKKFTISELFHIISGTPINEKEAYQNQGDIPVISSRTYNNGVIFKVDKKFLLAKGRIFNKKGISWTIDGNAGKLFVQEGEYFLSNHAGILIPRKKNINLEWFCFHYQKKFQIVQLLKMDKESLESNKWLTL